MYAYIHIVKAINIQIIYQYIQTYLPISSGAGNSFEKNLEIKSLSADPFLSEYAFVSFTGIRESDFSEQATVMK